MREAIEQRGGHLGIVQNANAARGANARWLRRRRGHEFSLEGRTALVTGAVRESERRSPKRSHSTARESRSVISTMKARIAPAGLLPKMGPAVVQLRCDVAEETSVAALTDWAMEHRTLLMYTRRRLTTTQASCQYLQFIRFAEMPMNFGCSAGILIV